MEAGKVQTALPETKEIGTEVVPSIQTSPGKKEQEEMVMMGTILTCVGERDKETRSW